MKGGANCSTERVLASNDQPRCTQPPSTAEKYPPPPGAWCNCCYGTKWWTERYQPKGWRRVTCHPRKHLRDDQIWINDQPAPLPREPTGPLLVS